MPGQIIARGKSTWLVRIYLGRSEDGKRQYLNKTIHGAKRDAEGELTRMLRDRDTGKLTAGGLKLTLGALLDEVLTDYRLQGRKSTDWAEMIVEKNLKPFFGSMPASKLNSGAVEQYVQHRQGQKRAAATIGNDLAILRRALNLALRAGKIGRAPFIPKPRVQNARQGFIEPEQYKTLRDALPDHLKPLFVVGYHTGIRLGELRAIEWSQVDLLAGEIRLAGSQTKNSQPRTVPIYGEMRPFLELALQQRNRHPACPFVFNFHGRRIGGHVKGWTAGCKQAGLPGLHFHDLRRSAVRAMERAGIPRHIAMSISGHRTEAVYRRYDIVSPRDLQEAGRQLDSYLKSKWQPKQEPSDTQVEAEAGSLAHPGHTKGLSGIQ
ncbi:MAG: site-specific integrase [Acidobacteriota bacterium]